MFAKIIVLGLAVLSVLMGALFWHLFFRRQKQRAQLIVLDGVSSVGKSTIARAFMQLHPDVYTLVGIDDFVTPVFLEYQKNPVPFDIFMQRIDECNAQMFAKIRALLASGKPVILDTVMARLRGIASIDQDLYEMRELNRVLVLIHLPLPLLVQRVAERNARAHEQNRPQESRSLILSVRQLSATYKERSCDAEIDLGFLSRQELEQACQLARPEFGDDEAAYAQFKNEVFGKLGMVGRGKIRLTTRFAYDLVVPVENKTPAESAREIHTFLARKEQSLVVRSRGVDLYTEHFGNRSKPAVLLISGAMASARFWPDNFCQDLAGQGYFVIRFDQRDMGLSSAVVYATHPYTLKDLEKDVVAILDAYSIKKAHLVGHSMGGAIAQLVAIDYPKRVLSVVPISSAAIARVPLGEHEKALLGQTWSVLLQNKPTTHFDESVDGFMRSYAHLHGDVPMDQALARQYIHDLYARSRPEHIAWFEQFSSGAEPMHNHVKAQQSMPDRTAELQKVRAPILVIHGTKDCLSFARLMKEYCVDKAPHATMHEIDGMGHMILNNELWKQIERLVIDFWTR